MSTTVQGNNSNTTQNKVHPNKAAFIEGIDHVFAKWTALLLAVENEWGGPDSIEKRDWMVDMVVDLFDKDGKNVIPEDVEDRLLQIMEDEFQTQIEDSSARDIGVIVCQMFKECIHGDHSRVDKLLKEREEREAAKAEKQIINSSKGQVESDSEDGSDDENEVEMN
ncbi:rRNA accumulation- protein [Mycoemilia scoparia]|uniref:rRNA accumulation- protein n=1 Tax=Mycoemilia scoparia TaxID=417184 RepID=A0A9W8AB33_9FUNG|nr:rRNA accumulation- protein [Mycoemilia scoparia]